jgi:hypothetical protein
MQGWDEGKMIEIGNKGEVSILVQCWGIPFSVIAIEIVLWGFPCIDPRIYYALNQLAKINASME